MRHVLDQYAGAGGRYEELVIADCGHSPHIEKPAEFRARFFAFLAQHAATHQEAHVTASGDVEV